MSAVKWLATLVGVAVVLLVAVPVFLPTLYRVERSIVIGAEPPRIHAIVGDLREWERWAPWHEADPTLETTIEAASGVGARQRLTGESGTGELAITASDPEDGIAYDLSWGERYASSGTIRYERLPEGTRVTWVAHGTDRRWLARYYVLMMEPLVGPMLERGLSRLAGAVDAEPAVPTNREADPD